MIEREKIDTIAEAMQKIADSEMVDWEYLEDSQRVKWRRAARPLVEVFDYIINAVGYEE